MITRGHLIGQIIDELTTLSNQVKSRTLLGLTDLNIFLEDFFKEILNVTYVYNLKNLNTERSNNPGVDLADSSELIAFQITSTKSSEKVNKTLEKIVNSGSQYNQIIILILQDKQNTYCINPIYTEQLSFSENNIWDINDLLKDIMSLKIDKLENLYNLIKKEIISVKIELEIPDLEGNYQTNIATYIESIPKENFEGITSYLEFYNRQYEGKYEYNQTQALSHFKIYIGTLKKLPRITRQFYAMILERGNKNDYGVQINYDYLKRICNYPDIDGEIRLLQEMSLLKFDEPNEMGESALFKTSLPRELAKLNKYFMLELVEYTEAKQIHISKAITILDFSDFHC